MTLKNSPSKPQKQTENPLASKELPPKLIPDIKKIVEAFYDKQAKNKGISTTKELNALQDQLHKLLKPTIPTLEKKGYRAFEKEIKDYLRPHDINFSLVVYSRGIDQKTGESIFQVDMLVHPIKKERRISIIPDYEDFIKTIEGFNSQNPFGKKITDEDKKKMIAYLESKIPKKSQKILELGAPQVPSFNEYIGRGFQMGITTHDAILLFPKQLSKMREKLKLDYAVEISNQNLQSDLENNEIAHKLFWAIIPDKEFFTQLNFGHRSYTVSQLSEAHSSVFELKKAKDVESIMSILVAAFDIKSEAYMFTKAIFIDTLLEAIDSGELPPLKEGEPPLYYFRRILKKKENIEKFSKVTKTLETKIDSYIIGLLSIITEEI